MRASTLPVLLVLIGCRGEPDTPPPELILDLGDSECRVGEPDCRFSFGRLTAGEVRARAFLLRLAEGVTADVAGAHLIDADAAFSIEQDFEGTVTFREDAPLVVSARPPGAAVISGTLVVAVTHPEGNITVALESIGLLPEVDVAGANCDFGEVELGIETSGCIVSIRNSTARPLIIVDITADAPFSVPGLSPDALPFELDPLQTYAVSVHATPTEGGLITGNVTFHFPDSEATQHVSVRGI